MKQNKSLFVCCLLYILSSTTITAQTYSSNYSYQSDTIRSDYFSKSVLVSNILSNRAGDMSPVIGAANWTDSGRQLECRSLLEFNYLFLPQMIINNPSLISSAELVLYPLQVAFSQNDKDKPSKFIVRRVLETWEDSATRWLNQPSADLSRQVKKEIKVKNKNYPVHVDVTKLVTDMLRYGNNGFMICPENSSEQSIASGQLFASPKNDDENLCPLLVINYRMAGPSIYRPSQNPSLSNNSWGSGDIGDIQRHIEMWMLKEPIPRNPPAVQPAPNHHPAPTIPVKN